MNETIRYAIELVAGFAIGASISYWLFSQKKEVGGQWSVPSTCHRPGASEDGPAISIEDEQVKPGTEHNLSGLPASSARQGSAEEEERLCRGCNGEGIVLDNVTVCEEFSECPACKGTGKRPDDTATGERGEVLSAEALTLRDWWDVFAKLNEVHWRYDPSMHSPDDQADEFAEALKRAGYLVSRISGDGTSERRADNAEPSGPKGTQ